MAIRDLGEQRTGVVLPARGGGDGAGNHTAALADGEATDTIAARIGHAL